MIIDVILVCSLNFCEFDCLVKKVAYRVRIKNYQENQLM